MGYFCAGCGRQPAQKKSETNGSASPPPPPPPPPPLLWSKLVFPTQQQGLLEEGREDVFQPTAAGTRESALYGSVRTVNRGGRLLASFHEGIDIAPVRRDRRGRPLDDVLAVAEGKVAYVNKVAGNSTYGKYAVVEHDDPMGPVYTLYAHLASVAVKRGDDALHGRSACRVRHHRDGEMRSWTRRPHVGYSRGRHERLHRVQCGLRVAFAQRRMHD